MASTHPQSSLHLEDRGSGSPVIFLHGSGGSAQDWAPQLDALSATHRVIAIDLRGFGRSPAIDAPVSLPEYAADVLAVLDDLGLERVVLVGLSLGGSVALQIAVDAPERVAGLVVADATSYVSEELSAMMIGSTAAAAEAGMAANVQMMRPLIFARAAIDADAEYIRAYEERFAAGDPAALGSASQAVARIDIHDRLAGIAVPTIVVVGAEDQLLPLPFSQNIADAIPGARLEIIEGASHNSNLDQPEVFTRVVRDLLATVA